MQGRKGPAQLPVKKKKQADVSNVLLTALLFATVGSSYECPLKDKHSFLIIEGEQGSTMCVLLPPPS